MEYILETDRLKKRFGKELAVNELNLQIRKGEIYGFLGPNGAGKTTTIRMLLALMHPTTGTVNIFGKDLRSNRIEILKKVGSLVENPSYYPHLTAFENLETVRKIYGAPKQRIDEVLSIVGLSDVAKKKVKGFSLGMKQRLGIAAALLNSPELLILDEPTNGLDPSGIIEIRNLLKQLATEYGITILISSHLLSEIDQIATSVGVISKGKLIFQDSIESMRLYSKKRIQLKVSNSEQAWQLLMSKGIKVDYEEGIISLLNMTDDDIAAVIRLLVENDYSVYRAEEAKRSLEDTFLQMTSEARERW